MSTLSEHEIANIFAAAQAGEDVDSALHQQQQAASGGRQRRVRRVDFSQPVKFNRDQQRQLERIHSAFARSVSLALAAAVRTVANVAVIDVKQSSWSHVFESVPMPSEVATLTVDATNSPMYLSMEQPMLLRLVDRLLGGDGAAPSRNVERRLTDIEHGLCTRLFETFTEGLSSAWDEFAGSGISMQRVERDLWGIAPAQVGEPAFLIALEAQLLGASMTLMVFAPSSAVEPLIRAGDERRDDSNVRAAIADVDIELRTQVGERRMTLRDIAALRPGDRIEFNERVRDGVTLHAGGDVCYRAYPGVRGRRRAVEIVERAA